MPNECFIKPITGMAAPPGCAKELICATLGCSGRATALLRGRPCRRGPSRDQGACPTAGVGGHGHPADRVEREPHRRTVRRWPLRAFALARASGASDTDRLELVLNPTLFCRTARQPNRR